MTKSRYNALEEAARLLKLVYDNVEENDYIDWSDVDVAYLQAKAALALPPDPPTVYLPLQTQVLASLWNKAGWLTRDERNALSKACAIMRRCAGENLRDQEARIAEATTLAAMHDTVKANKRRRIAERRANAERARLRKERES